MWCKVYGVLWGCRMLCSYWRGYVTFHCMPMFPDVSFIHFVIWPHTSYMIHTHNSIHISLAFKMDFVFGASHNWVDDGVCLESCPDVVWLSESDNFRCAFYIWECVLMCWTLFSYFLTLLRPMILFVKKPLLCCEVCVLIRLKFMYYYKINTLV